MEQTSLQERLLMAEISRKTWYSWEIGKYFLFLCLVCGAMKVIGSITAGTSLAWSLLYGVIFALGIGLLFVVSFEIITRLYIFFLRRKISRQYYRVWRKM